MQRQFSFNYGSKVSFNEPGCCIRFAETASLNLVSEKSAPLSFSILKHLNILLYSPTSVSRVIFNISQDIFHNTYETAGELGKLPPSPNSNANP